MLLKNAVRNEMKKKAELFTHLKNKIPEEEEEAFEEAFIFFVTLS